MGLLDISVSKEDRVRLDRMIVVLEEIARSLSSKELVAHVSLENKSSKGT